MVVSWEIIGPAGGSLLAAIGYLWREQLRTRQQTEAKLTKCEEGHAETANKLLVMAEQLGELRGRQDGVTQLAEQVLSAVSRKDSDE